MTIYDVAMAILVVAGMVWGSWRGITWQLASIASLILGYSVAHPLSGQLAPHFPGEPVVARSLAMLAIYAAVSGGVFLVAWIVRATLRQLKFEAFDRHLGMVLGGMEGALLGLVMTLFVVSLAPQTRAAIFTSPTGRVAGQVLDALGPVLPGELREVLAHSLKPSESPSGVEAQPVAPATVREEAGTSAGTNSQAEASSLRKLVEEGEATVGKAIAESAQKELQQLGGGSGNGREFERR
jgi:membrane protein required for colicin V production